MSRTKRLGVLGVRATFSHALRQACHLTVMESARCAVVRAPDAGGRGPLATPWPEYDGSLAQINAFLVAEAVDRRARRRASVDPATPRLREMLIVDEGWFVVRYAGAGAWIDELARRGRHWGLFLCFITQQLSDLTSDPAAAALFNQASCQLLFRQKDQRGSGDGESGMAWLARALGLSDEEVRRLEQLSSVPGEYAEMLLLRESRDHATARRGIVQVIAHPLEYWLMSSEPLYDVPRRQRMIAACGGDVWTALTLLAAGQEPPRQRLALVT